ncbi:major facilitator superfamily domain-containing protein [Astrocystis sublimbata]|nr:major facilitator superfamily domain-containing protein [Astrocystis sublimbata]
MDNERETEAPAERPDMSNEYSTGTTATEKRPVYTLAPESKPEATCTGSIGQTPYSIYMSRQKRLIVLAAAAGALVSPLTANIYLPAVHTLAEEFQVSATKINLTVTIYMVFQGLTPFLVAGLSDRAGRRPTFVICFILYTITNLTLSLTPKDYSALLVLRALQSAGAATMQNVNQAIMADIVTSGERGQYVGFSMSPAALGPSLGPLIGGMLAYYHGWRSIFWFLTVYGGLALVLLGLFLPETCRRLAGNGSVLPPKIYQTPWQLIKADRSDLEKKQPQNNHTNNDEDVSFRKALVQPLKIALQKENAILLLASGLTYSGVSATTTPLSAILANTYGLDTHKIGLIFLPIFGGSILAIGAIGWLMDRNYHRHAKRLELDLSDKHNKTQMDLATFPIERARVEVVFLPLSLCIVAMVLWGWLLEIQAPLAVVCVLIFLLGFAIVGANNVLSGLIIDLNPGNAGSAASANTLIKFAFGAVVSAVIQPLILALGLGWAYTFLAGIYLLICPILVLIAIRGRRWRLHEKVTAKDPATESWGGKIAIS